MKKSILIVLVFISSLQLLAQFEDLTFGTDSTLEIVSWNIEHFPKNGQATVGYVSQIIEALDVDVVAIQEVESSYWLDQLTDQLDGWDGYYAYNQYASLCYVYKTDVFEELNIFEIYTQKAREFPRSPLVMEMNYAGEHYVIINNHLKCCGDGLLDLNDDTDEEKRRFDACILLDAYIENNYPDERVVVLGDLNDILTDSQQNNVFQIFTENPASYLIADMDIAEGGTTNWSYPSWPSHIDHIFISNEIINEYLNYGSDIRTIKLDDYFDGGWSEYDDNISDHRPVGLKIKTDNNLGVESSLKAIVLKNYPNPVKNKTWFEVVQHSSPIIIKITNSLGQIVDELIINSDENTILWENKNLISGVYFSKLYYENKLIATGKIIISR